MALYTGRAKLYDGMKTLRAHWDQIQQLWNDPVRQDFEEHYWNVLEAHLQSALRGIDRMDQVLTKMRRDCS